MSCTGQHVQVAKHVLCVLTERMPMKWLLHDLAAYTVDAGGHAMWWDIRVVLCEELYTPGFVHQDEDRIRHKTVCVEITQANALILSARTRKPR